MWDPYLALPPAAELVVKSNSFADGGHLLYKVNGVVVNEAFEAKPNFGKILLQTEQAEMFVRRFELWPIGKAPAE